MAKKFNSNSEVLDLARALKDRRQALGYTLQYVENVTRINCGQLSRFESGDFKTISPNLHKYCEFLQIIEDTGYIMAGSLGERFEEFASSSPKHREAAEDILRALERLK
jgi:transcriptional regulator with XRE-family HTH domain